MNVSLRGLANHVLSLANRGPSPRMNYDTARVRYCRCSGEWTRVPTRPGMDSPKLRIALIGIRFPCHWISDNNNVGQLLLRYVYVCVHTTYSTVHTQAALCSWDIAEVQSTKTTFNSDCVYDSRHPVVPMSRTVAVYGVG